MTDSSKATRVTVLIELVEVDGFMLPDGSYRMSQAQAAETIGLNRRNAFEFFSRDHHQHSIVEVKSDAGKRGQARIDALCLEQVIDYWGYHASKGNLKAFHLLEAVAEHGFGHIPPKTIIVHYRKPGKKTSKEHEYASRLQSHLGGEKEVITPAGEIDLLTSTQIIVVKQIKQWKCAIGQVLVYSAYYPSHQKRIHLFGSCHENYLSLIESHCSAFGITVTWEP